MTIIHRSGINTESLNVKILVYNILKGIAYALTIAGIANIVADLITKPQFNNPVLSLEWFVIGFTTFSLGLGVEYALTIYEYEQLKQLLPNTITRREKPNC